MGRISLTVIDEVQICMLFCKGFNNRDRNRLVKSLVVEWNADIMSVKN